MTQAQANQVIQIVRRFSLEHWGAGEQTAWQTAKLLKRAGIPSTVYATAALEQAGREVVDQIVIQRFKYFYPFLGLTPSRRQALDLKGGNPYSLSLLKALWHSPGKLFHCHMHARLAAGVRVISKLKKVPYVVSLHSGAYRLPQSEQRDLITRSQGWGRYGFVLDQVFKPQRVLDDASGIICPSYDEFTAARKAFPLKPVLYLPGGVDPERFTQTVSLDVRAKYGIEPNKYLLLCSGRIDSQKNQLVLLNLMRELARHPSHEFHLILMGHLSNPSYFEQIRQCVKRDHLERDVTLITGLHSHSEELAAVYQQADALIIPSIHDPLGLPVMEGWISRLPVLAAKTGGLAHLVDDYETGMLFNPYCKRSLGEALNTLIQQPELRARLIHQGYQKVCKHFLWQHHIEKLRSFYEEIDIAFSSQSTSHLMC